MKRFTGLTEYGYRGCKIIARSWTDDNAWKDEYNSFEAQDENGKTLWLTDIMFECDYFDDCKNVIDKHLED